MADIPYQNIAPYGTKWFSSGDPRNKEILAAYPERVQKKMRVERVLSSKFPWQKYGKVYFKRNFNAATGAPQDGGDPGLLSEFGRSWEEATPEQKRSRSLMGYFGSGLYSNTGYGAHGSGRYSYRDFLGDVRETGRAIIGRKILDATEDRIARGIAGRGDYGDMVVPSVVPMPMPLLRPRKKKVFLDAHAGIHGMHSGNLGANEVTVVEANQLMNPQPSRAISTFDDETNTICISHTEYIGDITPTSTGFQTQFFLAINPGLSGTFPWLSNIAQFYEEYQIDQLSFKFKSMVTEGNANAGGNVIMATQYNPLAQAFTSKQVMENYDYSKSYKVTEDGVHFIECDPAKRGGTAIEYIRTGAVSTNQDLKTYDLAVFQLSTNNATANINLGELWVSYTVKLMKTKIPQLGQVGKMNGMASVHTLSAGTATNPLGTTAPVVVAAETNAIFDIPVSGTTYFFPRYVTNGRFWVNLTWTGVTTQPTVAATVTGTGCTISALNQTSIDATPASDSVFVTFLCTVENTSLTNATFVIGGLTSIVTTAGQLRVYQIFSPV